MRSFQAIKTSIDPFRTSLARGPTPGPTTNNLLGILEIYLVVTILKFILMSKFWLGLAMIRNQPEAEGILINAAPASLPQQGGGKWLLISKFEI